MHKIDPLFDLSGKTALVSGASRGIGEAIAHLLAAHGAHVICTSRKVESCQSVADAIKAAGGSAEARALHVGDVAAIFFDWPGPLLIIASSCGLVAAGLSLVVVILTPFVWQGGRRVDSFTQGRKLRFTWTAGVFLLFSVVLAFWGAIFPWAS